MKFIAGLIRASLLCPNFRKFKTPPTPTLYCCDHQAIMKPWLSFYEQRVLHLPSAVPRSVPMHPFFNLFVLFWRGGLAFERLLLWAV